MPIKRSQIRRGDSQLKRSRMAPGRKRMKSRVDSELVAWSKAIRERDGHECQVQRFNGKDAYSFIGLSCSGPLDAHHTAERSLRPDLKYDLTNGIALCRRHHDWIPLNRAEAIRIGLLNDETCEAAQKREAMLK